MMKRLKMWAITRLVRLANHQFARLNADDRLDVVLRLKTIDPKRWAFLATVPVRGDMQEMRPHPVGTIDYN